MPSKRDERQWRSSGYMAALTYKRERARGDQAALMHEKARKAERLLLVLFGVAIIGIGSAAAGGPLASESRGHQYRNKFAPRFALCKHGREWIICRRIQRPMQLPLSDRMVVPMQSAERDIAYGERRTPLQIDYTEIEGFLLQLDSVPGGDEDGRDWKALYLDLAKSLPTMTPL